MKIEEIQYLLGVEGPLLELLDVRLEPQEAMSDPAAMAFRMEGLGRGANRLATLHRVGRGLQAAVWSRLFDAASPVLRGSSVLHARAWARSLTISEGWTPRSVEVYDAGYRLDDDTHVPYLRVGQVLGATALPVGELVCCAWTLDRSAGGSLYTVWRLQISPCHLVRWSS